MQKKKKKIDSVLNILTRRNIVVLNYLIEYKQRTPKGFEAMQA